MGWGGSIETLAEHEADANRESEWGPGFSHKSSHGNPAPSGAGGQALELRSAAGVGSLFPPLQCSCLENPRDGGAWWAAISGVAQSRTRLKRLSSSSSSPLMEKDKRLMEAS